MSRILARFNDFSKGEAGWVDKARMQSGYFTGENVMVYRDGTIGPRSGLAQLQPTNWPAGTIFDMGYVDTGNSGDEYIWIRKGTTLARVRVYQVSGSFLVVPISQAFVQDATAFAAAAVGDSVDYTPVITLLTVFGDKCYKLNWSAGAGLWNSALAGSPGGKAIEIYGDQVVVGNVTNHPNRLVFSKQADYTTWPAANFLDVGNAGNAGVSGAPAITAIKKVKDQLLVFADTGQMWVITGLLGGKSTTVKEFLPGDHTNGPAGPKALGRDRAGGLWWSRREDIVAPDQQFDAPGAMPVTFMAGVRGEVPAQAGYLRQPNFTSNRTSDTLGFTTRNDKAALLADRGANGTIRALCYRDGVWTRHGLFDSSFTPLASACPGSRGDYYFGLTDAGHDQLMVWQVDYEHPVGFPTLALGASLPLAYVDRAFNGDPVAYNSWFATPEYRDPGFQVAAVEAIEVEYSSWVGDGVTHNHADVYLQQYEASGVQEDVQTGHTPPDYDVTAGSFTPPYGVTIPMSAAIDEIGPVGFGSTHRWRRRVRLYPESGQGKPTPAFRVLLRNMVNVSIHEIVVFGAITPPDRR